NAVLEEIKKNPTDRNINIAQMDNDSYCTCPRCAALDEREESHAGATLALVNAVAERIEKLHPEVLISTYAYAYTRKPPRTLKPRRNVMIQLWTAIRPEGFQRARTLLESLPAANQPGDDFEDGAVRKGAAGGLPVRSALSQGSPARMSIAKQRSIPELPITLAGSVKYSIANYLYR
ncbi:MAG: DUF4838 domain-containing protein, partial [Planctomycetes bacterium]|nr:DUF4838 domain-containing protein [Planctomycetota bacterium]